MKIFKMAHKATKATSYTLHKDSTAKSISAV